MFYSSENVAYKATAASSSTEDPTTLRSYDPENAVDGSIRTAAITKTEKNPWLSVTLSEFLNVSRVSVYLDIGKCSLNIITHFYYSFIKKACYKVITIYLITKYNMKNVPWQ